ncbi:MAG TPA: methyltransferase domain-containing protein [Candidatus Acidoferrum sp.]
MDALSGLQQLLDELDADRSLADLDRFRERVEALDRLDAYDFASRLSSGDSEVAEAVLYRRALVLRTKLEAANSQFYETIRDAIRRGEGRDALLWCASQPERERPRRDATRHSDSGDSYDYLDELVGSVFRFAVPDAPKIDLSPEMVAYQPTPARHIFDLIRRTQLTAEDVLIDLGSGLGHVPLLIASCTQASTVGIELEPSYVESARQSAKELNLTNTTFLAQDAREADLSRGTIFYLYTPFHGAILRAVLDRLRLTAKTREIRICTFGPCTPIVDAESWLIFDSAERGHISIFRSRR